MDPTTSQLHHERLTLICAALRGLFAGAAHALLSWLISNLAS
jgi:hypothetical protein